MFTPVSCLFLIFFYGSLKIWSQTGNTRKWCFIMETIAKLNSLAVGKKWVRISSLIKKKSIHSWLEFWVIFVFKFSNRRDYAKLRGHRRWDDSAVFSVLHRINVFSLFTNCMNQNLNIRLLVTGKKKNCYAAAESLQLCPTLCDPMDCSPPGSSIHGIFQARVLEWGAIAFSHCEDFSNIWRLPLIFYQ